MCVCVCACVRVCLVGGSGRQGGGQQTAPHATRHPPSSDRPLPLSVSHVPTTPTATTHRFDEDEFAPGLPKDGTIYGLIDELESSGAARLYVVKLLSSLAAWLVGGGRSAGVNPTRVWDALSTHRRARLGIELTRALSMDSDFDDPYSPIPTVQRDSTLSTGDCIHLILDSVCSGESWYAVWREAAYNRDLTVAGKGMEERSFFMALLRVCLGAARARLNAGLLCPSTTEMFSDDVTDHICGFALDRNDLVFWADPEADPEAVSKENLVGSLLGTLVRKWSAIQLKPPTHKNGKRTYTAAYATEKLACYRLAGTLGVDFFDFQYE